ncbi:MAG: hypothetical protein NVS4B8_24880 [Herpetosiphon sp.]
MINSSETPLFQNADEQERVYAPDQVPAERERVLADEQGSAGDTPPVAVPFVPGHADLSQPTTVVNPVPARPPAESGHS